MTRDMELVRQILIAIEASNRFEVPTTELEARLPDVALRDLVWHLGLMGQAGLVELKTYAVDIPGGHEESIDSVRITWGGFDFLAAAMNDTVWNGAKRLAGDMFKSLSISTLNALMQRVIQGQIPGL